MSQPPESAGGSERRPIEDSIALCRMLVGCFALAPAIFGVIVLSMNSGRGMTSAGGPLIAQILAGAAVVLLLLGVIIGALRWRALANERRCGQTPSPERLTGAVILRGAMLEGPALLGGVAALLGGSPYLFITLAGCALLAIMWVRLPDQLREMVGETARNPYRWER